MFQYTIIYWQYCLAQLKHTHIRTHSCSAEIKLNMNKVYNVKLYSNFILKKFNRPGAIAIAIFNILFMWKHSSVLLI